MQQNIASFSRKTFDRMDSQTLAFCMLRSCLQKVKCHTHCANPRLSILCVAGCQSMPDAALQAASSAELMISGVLAITHAKPFVSSRSCCTFKAGHSLKMVCSQKVGELDCCSSSLAEPLLIMRLLNERSSARMCLHTKHASVGDWSQRRRLYEGDVCFILPVLIQLAHHSSAGIQLYESCLTTDCA